MNTGEIIRKTLGKNFCVLAINFTWVICVCSFDSSAQCLTAPFGQKPAATQTILQCNGTYQTMSDGGFNGEYTKLNVTVGNTYSFKSSESTDFITISNEIGTIAFVFDTGAVSWTASQTTVVRFYTHSIKGCGSDNGSKRRREASCIAPGNYGTPTVYYFSCPASAGNPVVSAITNTSATISWPAAAQSSQSHSYEFELRTSGLPSPTLEGLVRKWATPGGVTFAQVTGLNPYTTYYVFVRVKCGIGTSATYSAYTSSNFFTTR